MKHPQLIATTCSGPLPVSAATNSHTVQGLAIRKSALQYPAVGAPDAEINISSAGNPELRNKTFALLSLE